jgi:hypothetical protein
MKVPRLWASLGRGVRCEKASSLAQRGGSAVVPMSRSFGFERWLPQIMSSGSNRACERRLLQIYDGLSQSEPVVLPRLPMAGTARGRIRPSW